MNRKATTFYVVITCLTFLSVVLRDVEPARILAAIPVPSYSHQVYFRNLWRELAHRGHDVVVMTTDPARENVTNLKEIDLGSAYAISRLYKCVIDANADAFTEFKCVMEELFNVAEHEFALPQVRQIIDDPSQHFDVVLTQCYHPYFYGLPHRFKAPFIMISSLDLTNADHSLIGNAAHSVLYPHVFLSSQTNLNFIQRLLSFRYDIMVQKELWKISKKMNELNRRVFGEDFPDYYALLESVDLLFFNNNPLFTTVRPLSPNSVSIAGGLHLNEPKSLPIELQQFLDASSQGMIYFSLGSNVKSRNLPKKLLTTLAKTFAQLPYNILWKFEDDHLPNKPKNVKIMKWIPQQDVLRHRNIKLFITQGGAQSLEEALFAHVPLIVIPFINDQIGNAEHAANNRVAIRLDANTLTVDEFKKAILEVIRNPMYKNNIKSFATMLGDQPMTSVERAVWWTEYLIRHKSGRHLKTAKIPLYQYFYLDIWVFLIASSLITLVIVYYIYLRLWVVCLCIFDRTTRKLKQL